MCPPHRTAKRSSCASAESVGGPRTTPSCLPSRNPPERESRSPAKTSARARSSVSAITERSIGTDGFGARPVGPSSNSCAPGSPPRPSEPRRPRSVGARSVTAAGCARPSVERDPAHRRTIEHARRTRHRRPRPDRGRAASRSPSFGGEQREPCPDLGVRRGGRGDCRGSTRRRRGFTGRPNTVGSRVA